MRTGDFYNGIQSSRTGGVGIANLERAQIKALKMNQYKGSGILEEERLEE
jgi:hypothetical protein